MPKPTIPFVTQDLNGNSLGGPSPAYGMTPVEALKDPVNKLRVSTPQSLIDTDFEYSTQSTKWESLGQVSNRPGAFYDVTTPLKTVTGISGAGTRVITVLLTDTSALSVGQPVFIQDTTSTLANGWYLVESISASTNFTFTCKANVSGSIFDSTKTYIFPGSFYSSSNIPVSASAGAAFTNVGTTVTATTTNAHGLTVGNNIYVIGTTATTNAPNGSWTIASVPTSNTFTFTVVNAPTGTITAAAGANLTLYPRLLSSSVHRPYDGGVTFNVGTNSPNNEFVRQTRAYFRYQSGKGIQFSTGTILKPNFQIDSITNSGTTVTVNTKFAYNVGVGAVIYVSGANEAAYNGTFTVTSAPTDTSFTYTALTTPPGSQATGFPLSVGLSSWTGSVVRVGMFDRQNGFFFEFDGTTLWVVRRKSTDQLAGTIAVTNGSNSVVGTNTLFSSQLKPGDFIVIRGQSYEVTSITSDTQLYIVPEYKGSTIAGSCIISKTSDLRIPQTSWNIDTMDGNGVTGYNLDLTKMQMLYMDYTWYGAGNIRYGFRGVYGEVTYAHKIVNANANTEAYMRSGNLPARYEVSNVPYYTYLTATLASGTTTGGTISVADSSKFPATGNILIQAAGNTGAAVEIISYTANANNTLTIGSRAVTGGAASAQTFTFSATAPIQVQLYTPQISPTMSHWGSSVIMDGRFDDDKAFVFQSGITTPLTNLATSTSTNNALIGLRLAPSVDSGQTGLLGAKELINRMQLQLSSMSFSATAGATTPLQILIKIILNGRLSTAAGNNWTGVGGSSLAQQLIAASGTSITGGEVIYSEYITVNPSSVNQNTFDLTKVRNLANSILGGGNTLAGSISVANIYPDGTDIIWITATNISTQTTNSVAARISWTEAQA